MSKSKFLLGDALSDVLGSVSKSDTEELLYIDITLLDSDERNFYALDGIDELAANIELCGLQQPIRVRVNPDMPGRYRIVSGHRRRAALWSLYEYDPERWGKVPCIIEADDVSDAMQELRLIYANADTRRLKDADLAKQAERVQELLYQLKEEGVEFPGRMRDHVAEACKISATKLATLKIIRENLVSTLQPRFEEGKLPTETAYQLARMPEELQVQLVKACPSLTASEVQHIANAVRDGADYNQPHTCPDGKRCTHADAFLRHDVIAYRFEQCKGDRCCLDCPSATRSYSPCQNLCSKAKELKKAKKDAEQDQRDKIATKEQAKRDKVIKKDAQRLMRAVEAAGLDDDKTLALGYITVKISSLRLAAEEPLDPTRDYQNEDIYKIRFRDDIIQNARALGCSADYLLGLTNDLTPAATDRNRWQTGAPEASGIYVAKFYSEGMDRPILEFAIWDENDWKFLNFDDTIDMPCVGWVKIPEV